MSGPKLISPLLDGFVMGPPISSHHGVRCCPAMKQNSDNKYIVKIISVPASQSQLDALLLTGAYKDAGEAMDYFKSQTDAITADAELLSKASAQGGFLAYDSFQTVPMEDNRLGYLVYLLGSYKRSLDRTMRRTPQAVLDDVLKLGSDICSALAACRSIGSVYVALKPTNIFLSSDREFRIGDLGFVAVDSLQYTSLPAKYRSPYCPPEVLDPMQTLNGTVDTYALGMVLYQICNDGKLPAPSDDPAKSFPPPAHAEGKLSELIMKAISPDRDARFADPAEMGQAIAACMEPKAAAPAAVSSDTQVFSTEDVSKAAEAISQDTRVIPDVHTMKEEADGSAAADTRIIPSAAVAEAVARQDADTKVIPAEAVRQAVSSDTRVIPTDPARQTASSDTRVIAVESIRQSVSSDTRVMPDLAAERPAPLKQAQETKVLSAVPAPDSTPAQEYNSSNYYDDDDDDDEDDDEISSVPTVPRRVRKPMRKGWIAWLIVILLLGALGYGAYHYYCNYYMQTIDSLTVSGEHDTLTVTVVTQIDESLLTVTCADTYGNSMEKKLSGGKAEFTGLLPNSQYKVSIEIEGFHELTGKTSDVFNTETRTEIVSFSGIAGSEDGSVMLTFTVDGPEPEKWILTYSAEGEDPLTEEFTGHSIIVRDLAFPKLYTFRLSPSEDMFVTGQTSLEFSSTSLVMARALTITSCNDGEMTVCWEQPSDITVGSWTVRCYSDGGYDQTVETTELQTVFTQIDPSYGYYVEVTAEGMTQPARTSITADPITITDLIVDESDPSKLVISWDHKGKAPEGGWLLMYSMDDANTQSIVKCSGASAEIAPRIHGAKYRFVIQAADSTSIFSNIHSYQCPEAQPYKDHSFDPTRTTAYLLVTPEKEDWTGGDVTKKDYTDSFRSGERISILLFCDNRFYIPADELSVLYVIRNSEGQVLTNLVSEDTDDWHDLWVAHNTNYGELDLPMAPTELGSYDLRIYFNGMLVASAAFSITE